MVERVAQSNFTWVSANLVINGTNWTNPSWVKPYKIFKIGTAFVGVITGNLKLHTDSENDWSVLNT